MIIASHNAAVLCLFEPSTWISPQLEESAPEDPKDPGRTSRCHTLEEVVDHLETSLQGGNRSSLTAFLCIYPRYTTILQALDLLVGSVLTSS